MSTSKCLVPCRHAHRSVVLFSVPRAFARSSLAQGTISAKNLPLVEIENMAAYGIQFLALWVKLKLVIRELWQMSTSQYLLSKSKNVPGPWALKHYQSLGVCKIYYSHFIFEVITFLSKIQNHSKKLSNHGIISKIGRKNHYLENLNSKIGRKNHYLEFLNLNTMK